MKSRIDLMSESKPIGREERARRRLTPDVMTPEQRAAYALRRSARETPQAKAQLARDIESIRREFPPLVADEALLSLLAELRAERERQGLSLTDVMALTRIDRATINKLENGKVPNPTYSTLKAYAKALGMRLAFNLGRAPTDSTP
jgi:ribosome-binding protein aMBF1 (putative translation factor)